jgi:hypothetical protein
MPAVDYNYDYYSSNARKINKTANSKRATKKVDSSVSLSSNRKEAYERKTSQSTKEQVRRATYETPKKVKTTKKKNIELDVPIATKKKVAAKPVEMKLKKPQQSAKQKKKAMEQTMSRVKNVCYLLIGFGIAFLICYRYSLINEKFNELEKTKKALATAQTVNEQIQADIDSQTDLSYVENYAKYQLGMQKPSNSQIVYVNIEKQDRILTPITIEEDSNETWFEQLYENIVKLFE